MNRRIFGKKSAGWLAAVGAVFGVKTATAERLSTPMAGGRLEVTGVWSSEPEPTRTDRYGVFIKLDSPIIQNDGTRLDNFEFSVSCCRTSWRLRYRETRTDGTVSRPLVLCRGDNMIDFPMFLKSRYPK